jgi:hypothetical protein
LHPVVKERQSVSKLISDVNSELSIHVDAAAAQLLEQDSADAEMVRYEKHKIFGKLNAVLETIELRDSTKKLCPTAALQESYI